MFKDILQVVNGIEIYSIISILIFFALFVGLAIRAFTLNGTFIDRMSKMPLDDNNRDNSET